ncbi:MAG: single-stranded DNA-binding protein [Candidatus Omnitrophica bacterium]|nr:single-stranded DNA-binding protein [Candidatus Omnitrophota bacterium]
MASLNKVFLMGNLTRDPELRYVPSGTAVATFTIAINRVYTSQAGEKKEEVSFVRVVVWGRRAEVSGEYLSKGSPVFVEGRLQSRSWEGQDGQKRNTIEVIADNVQFLRGAGGAGKAAPDAGQKADTAPSDVATINLNDDLAPIPDNEGTKSQYNKSANQDEAPF